MALAAPAIVFGPYWAGLMSTFGLGGLLAGRLRLDRPATMGAVVAVMILASLAVTTTTSIVVVTITQVILALVIMIASIYVTRLLHDAVPSTIRSGVASGAGAISWMVFLPVALAFGLISTQQGVHTAGWMLTAITTSQFAARQAVAQPSSTATCRQNGSRARTHLRLAVASSTSRSPRQLEPLHPAGTYISAGTARSVCASFRHPAFSAFWEWNFISPRDRLCPSSKSVSLVRCVPPAGIEPATHGLGRFA